MELLTLRGEVARMKSAENDPLDVAAKTWLAKANKLRQRMADHPDAKIPELQLLTDDDWLGAARSKLDTDTDYRRAQAELRHDAENKFAETLLKPALASYADANGNHFPTDLTQLQPYFGSTVDDAILQRWEIVPASTVPNVGVGPVVVTEKAAVDDLLDSRMAIGTMGYGSMEWLTAETQDALKPVYKAFTDANGNINWSKFDLSQLLPYATTADQQTAVKKMIAQKALRN